MSPDNKQKIMELVRKAVEERLSGLKDEIAAARSDMERRLGQVSSSLDKVLLTLPEDKIEELLHAGRPSPSEDFAPPADFAKLRESVNVIETGTSQVSILQELLRRAAGYCRRCALFVVRDQGKSLVGWAAMGFTGCGDMPDDGIKKVTLPFGMKTVVNTVFDRAVFYSGPSDQHAENIQLFEMIGSLDPVEIVAVPLMKSGKVAAVLYGDSGDSQMGLASADAVELLVRVTGMSIDLIPLKQKLGTTAPPSRPAEAAQPAEVKAQAPAPAAARPAPAPAPPKAATPVPAAAPARPAAPVAKAPAEAAAPSALSPEEQKLHNEAKRFARLLVSEIKLYNEAKVVEGRKNKDLYKRLKEDIDRSRQMYNQRYPNIAATTGYFDQELVNTLAEGQPAALGM